MAIIENKSTEEGDVLVIKPEVPIVGLISLYQFVDHTINESLTDYFRKEFRYSVDGGITFSSWSELTLLNIQEVNITRFNQFVIEYQYTRVGNTPTVELAFEDILVSGTFEDLDYPTYDKTPFKSFFEITNINVYGWALNVLEKLYHKGFILPDYIQRADNNDNLEDEDFIVYWNSITHFFALLVYFARQFENFETNEILLQEFLKNKDLAFAEDNNLQDLLYIYNNYIEEYKKRGTLQIIKNKAVTGNIDGELLRLINYRDFEEFIFGFFQNFESGWCIGKSSPTWKNTENIINLRKGYEFTKDVVDLNKYPLLSETYITLANGYMVIDEVPLSTPCGIGDDGDVTKKILMSPNEDYEISFRVKQESPVNNISFGATAFDITGNIINLLNDVGVSNYFFENKGLPVADNEYWVRAVIWNKNKLDEDMNVPNVGFGKNLKSTSAVTHIIPKVIVTSGSPITTKTYIRDLTIRPLKLNFSRGQLGLHNLIYILFKNNNGEFNSQVIKDLISDKLVPYNSFVKIKTI